MCVNWVNYSTRSKDDLLNRQVCQGSKMYSALTSRKHWVPQCIRTYHYLYFSFCLFSKGEFLYSTISNPQDCSKHFTLYSLATLFNRTSSQLLWEASSYAAINAQRLSVHKYPPMFLARYSFVQLSELEQCKKLAQGLTQQHRIRTRVLLVESPKL